MDNPQVNVVVTKHQDSLLRFVAWTMMLCASDLVDILWKSIGSESASISLVFKLTALGIFLALTWTVKPLRSLWQFALILPLVYLSPYLLSWINDTKWWQTVFADGRLSFVSGQSAIQLSELVAMIFVIALLWVLKRQPRAFFLDKGQLDAPLEPVRWLGIRRGETWKRFGWIFAICFGGGTVIFLAISSLPLLDKLGQGISLLPWAVLFAAMNALGEELTFRAPLLSTSHEVISRQSALWMTSIYFGLAHYLYGDPSGLIGFLLTTFIAYLLGKSMLETRGVFWAWFIHFMADVPIFAFYVLKSM
jgi:membrane protease YdiL (CAAX protease family)